MKRLKLKVGLVVLCAAATVLQASASSAEPPQLFVMIGEAGPATHVGGSNNLVDLMDDFISAEPGSGWGLFAGLSGYNGRLSYLGVEDALVFSVTEFSTKLTLVVPSTNAMVEIRGLGPDRLADNFNAWLESSGADQWFDFLRAMNGATPLAVISGNPKSTVALMGDNAYRKFGFDDSRSRMGSGEKIKRWGGFELRVDAGFSAVRTENFDDDLWTVDPSLTFAGDFGRHVGLSFSLIGQYRSYENAAIADIGAELALPITFKRPDEGPYFWQLTPFVQAAGGVSVDFAAGGLFMGGGVVNAFGWNRGPFEVLMSNEIAYYGGIPINDIGGYSFDTRLSQLYFKNGLEATWWMRWGFYSDAGVHFSNFAVDRAAVPWFATPTVGLGWQAGRWVDLRLAYEADLSADEYRSHNLQLKLDFLF